MSQRRCKRQAVWLSLALVSALLLAACAGPATETPAAPTQQPPTQQPTAAPPAEAPYVDVLRLPSGGYWGHLSPFGFNRGPGFSRASLIFDTLVWRDASGETIPWLATDWAMSVDGLTWTFTLRDGVRWQDGQPLTVDDVVFSIEYYLAHPGARWFMAQVGQISSAEALGDRQVAIKLAQPFAPFLQTVAEAMLIFPQHIWQDVSDPQAFTAPEAFIGSGAYRLVEYSQEEGTYLFEANPDFFLGLPYVRRIEYVPSSDVFLALSNGDVHAFDKFGGVTEEMLAPFRQEPFVVGEAPGEFGMYLYFNLEKDTPLQDLRVRQAIAHAVDRQAMVERILFGLGDPGNPGFLPPSNPAYNPEVTEYAHDPAKARALLQEAGYDGTPIQVAYSPDWIMASPRVIEILEAGLSEVGIALQKVSMDQATIDAAANKGSYEMLISGFGGLGADADLLRRSFASTSQATGFSRALGYRNAEFDELANAQVSMTDPAERQAALEQMQAILAQDLPVLGLYYTARVVVYNEEVFDNWYFTPGGYGGGIPQPYSKHQFIVGVPEGLTIKGTP